MANGNGSISVSNKWLIGALMTMLGACVTIMGGMIYRQWTALDARVQVLEKAPAIESVTLLREISQNMRVLALKKEDVKANEVKE